MREELLEDIWYLELSARGCPLTGVFTILVLGNINGVVDEAHAIISRFVLENITVQDVYKRQVSMNAFSGETRFSSLGLAFSLCFVNFGISGGVYGFGGSFLT